jgi:hypothetical protein
MARSHDEDWNPEVSYHGSFTKTADELEAALLEKQEAERT